MDGLCGRKGLGWKGVFAQVVCRGLAGILRTAGSRDLAGLPIKGPAVSSFEAFRGPGLREAF